MAATRTNPLFQHRHYAALAKGLDGLFVICPADLADIFAKDNPRFDRARFLAACDANPTNKRDKREGESR